MYNNVATVFWYITGKKNYHKSLTLYEPKINREDIMCCDGDTINDDCYCSHEYCNCSVKQQVKRYINDASITRLLMHSG